MRRPLLLPPIWIQLPHKPNPILHRDLHNLSIVTQITASISGLRIPGSENGGEFEDVWDAETVGDVFGVLDVVAVEPDLGCGVEGGEVGGDEEGGTDKGCFAIGCGGGGEICVVIWEGRGERVLCVDGVEICGGETGIVVFEEGGYVVW